MERVWRGKRLLTQRFETWNDGVLRQVVVAWPVATKRLEPKVQSAGIKLFSARGFLLALTKLTRYMQ